MGGVAIKAVGLGKRYQIGERQKYKAMRDSLTDAMYLPFRALRRVRNSSGDKRVSAPTIWALKDVSFEIQQGEVVGVIGRNGAGKSTLLKILSRITEPTRGFVDLFGRVGSLLEVGTGFHSELTGRENTYLNGSIIGMKKREVDQKFDEIVSFAEIEKFLDTPVKFYSSGMYMRLAFAVAAHLEPEILLVDEVLAVGDAVFQKKCIGKMSDVSKEGRTVFFVSHNLATVNSLCERVLWLDGGNLQMSGRSEEVISSYVTSGATWDGQREWKDGASNRGVDVLKINSVCIRDQLGHVTSRFEVHQPFSIEITYTLNEPLSTFCRVGFFIKTDQGITLFEAYDSDDGRYGGPRVPGTYMIRCDIGADVLNAGRYVLSLNAGMPNVMNLAHLDDVLMFDIEDTEITDEGTYIKREGIMRPHLQWSREVRNG